MRHHLATAALAACGTLTLVAQQPPVRFRVDVSLVEIDAIVTDSTGKPVRGLAKDDFQVLVDGKPQEIAAFTMVDIPIARAEPPPGAGAPVFLDPDVASNHDEFDGRIFVIVLDDLQTAVANTTHVRRAARQFVERHVGDNDLVAVAHTGFSSGRGQDLTRSKARVLEIIDAFTGHKMDSETRLKAEWWQVQQYIPPEFRREPDTFDAIRAQYARASLGALERMSAWVGRIAGRRKAVVYFGEGVDYDMREQVNTRAGTTPSITRDIPAIQAALRDLIASATRAGVSIYTIDPRGLSTGMEEAVSISGNWDPQKLGGPGLTTLMDEMQRAHTSLRTISESTGGLAFVNRNDFTSSFTRIVDDNSTYYLLGYYEKKKPKPGDYPRVDVRVNKPGLQVRARHGYLGPTRTAPPPVFTKMSEAMRTVLQSPIPVSGLGLSVFTASFQGRAPDATVRVVVEIAPSALRFTEKNGRFEGDVELAIAVSDLSGAAEGYTLVDTVKQQLLPETHALVARHGVRIMRLLGLRPGRYRLAIGGRDVTSGAVGSVLTDVDVPDLFAPPLQMSSVTLASTGSTARVPTMNAEAGVTDVLPGAATTVRQFSREETLSVYAEIYDNDALARHRVSFETTIRTPDGAIVFTGRDDDNAGDTGPVPQAPKVAWSHGVRIPLLRYTPGRYVLRVEARRLLSDRSVTAREVEFRIE
jgi:VWFA-related protein